MFSLMAICFFYFILEEAVTLNSIIPRERRDSDPLLWDYGEDSFIDTSPTDMDVDIPGPLPPANSDVRLWFRPLNRPRTLGLDIYLGNISLKIQAFGSSFPICLTSSCIGRCFWSRNVAGWDDCSCDLNCYNAGDCCLDFEQVCYKAFKNEGFDFIDGIYSALSNAEPETIIRERIKRLFPSALSNDAPSEDNIYKDNMTQYGIWNLSDSNTKYQMYYINNCSADNTLYERCNDPGEETYPILGHVNGIRRLYKNKYCLECAGREKDRLLTPWAPRYYCKSPHTQIAFMMYGTGPVEKFVDYVTKNCLKVYDPTDHQSLSRSLVMRDFIAQCKPDFGGKEQDNFTENACKSFHGPLQQGRYIYANAFCAYCNGVEGDDLKQLSCGNHKPYVTPRALGTLSNLASSSSYDEFQFAGFGSGFRTWWLNLNGNILCDNGQLRDVLEGRCMKTEQIIPTPKTATPDQNRLEGAMIICLNFISDFPDELLPLKDAMNNPLTLNFNSIVPIFSHNISFINKNASECFSRDIDYPSIIARSRTPITSQIETVFGVRLNERTITEISVFIFNKAIKYVSLYGDQLEPFDLDKIKILSPFAYEDPIPLYNQHMTYIMDDGRDGFYLDCQVILGLEYSSTRIKGHDLNLKEKRYLAFLLETNSSCSVGLAAAYISAAIHSPYSDLSSLYLVIVCCILTLFTA